jgi:hypothetical protein
MTMASSLWWGMRNNASGESPSHKAAHKRVYSVASLCLLQNTRKEAIDPAILKYARCRGKRVKYASGAWFSGCEEKQLCVTIPGKAKRPDLSKPWQGVEDRALSKGIRYYAYCTLFCTFVKNSYFICNSALYSNEIALGYKNVESHTV